MNRRRIVIAVVSFVLHVGLLAGTGLIPVPAAVEQVLITMRVVDVPPEDVVPDPAPSAEGDAMAPEPAPDAAAPEPPAEAPEPPPEPRRRERREPTADSASSQRTDSSSDGTAGGGVADFGVVLTGPGGPGGVAVAVGRPDGSGWGGGGAGSEAGAGAVRETARTIESPPTETRRERCAGDTRGPVRPRGLRRPAYPDAAIEAGVHGRVRVRVEVDENGHPVRLEALDDLGFGLTDAALRSLEGLVVDPALRCGRPVAGVTTIAVRFDP